MVELKEVKYEHFFWIPENQHMVLARMKRPQEVEIKKTNNRHISNAKLPVKVTFSKSDSFNEIHNRFKTSTIILLEDLSISIIDSAEQSSVDIPINILNLSISHKIMDHKGQYNLFNGLAEIYLSMTVKNQKGESIRKKTWTVRRFISESPDDLNESSKLNVLIKTLNKGFLEFENEFLHFFNRYLLLK